MNSDVLFRVQVWPKTVNAFISLPSIRHDTCTAEGTTDKHWNTTHMKSISAI